MEPSSDPVLSCPVCRHAAGRYAIAVDRFDIHKCGECGLEYTHPMPSDQELSAFYSTYHDVRARPEIVRRNAERNLERLADFGLHDDSRILDFGAGSGAFVSAAGERCYGLELGAPTQSRIFADVGQLPLNRFDFITLWGVLEHLNDPLGTLRTLVPTLNDGGKLVITTVDAEGIIPYYYKPVEHLTYWTQNAFQRLFEQCGLRAVHSQPYTMVQASDVYLDRLLSRTPEQYRPCFAGTLDSLPDLVEVPTNEILVIAEKA